MPELVAVVVARDTEQRSILQLLVEGTRVARVVQSFGSLPLASTDPIVRRIRDEQPDVVLLDIPSTDTASALRSIEVLHQELPRTALFAIGSMTQPHIIVTAMRTGAKEFLERPVSTTSLLEAFVRLTTTQRGAAQRESVRGKVFTVINAKGGCGSTTIAVNLALALQSAEGQTSLVDLAPLGHTALHLNLRPSFTAYDAIRNLHRLDSSLLESFTTRHAGGLQLLAGAASPGEATSSPAEVARLFDLLTSYFRFTVVDLSTRTDALARLVCDLSQTVLIVAGTDVASLWSTARVQQYLSESGGRDRLRLLLNRFRKIPGFTENEVESASGLTVFWKIPNQYFAVSGAIDRGVPLMPHDRSALSRAFAGLAARLTEGDAAVKRPVWSLFKIG
jgi:pilus assembly protein CpaE